MFILSCIAGLSATSCGAQQVADAADTETDQKEMPNRDIVLVIAGGDGYVDFRRGIELVLLSCYFL